MATVLLVEDDPAARQGLELALRRLGYGVRAAETGEAALRDLGDAAADVVVLDVMLPGLDGFEVCRRLSRGCCWSCPARRDRCSPGSSFSTWCGNTTTWGIPGWWTRACSGCGRRLKL